MKRLLSNSWLLPLLVLLLTATSTRAQLSAEPSIPAVIVSNWTSFNAIHKNNAVELIWSIENETEMSHFDIERSINNKDWETIGLVSCKNEPSSRYSFNDQSPVSAKAYYRIKSTDKVGNIAYSKIVGLLKPSTGGILISANPVRGGLFHCFLRDNELLLKEEVQVSIYDFNGVRVFQSRQKPENIMRIQYGQLQPGRYVLILQAEDKQQQTSFMIQ